MPSYLFKIIVAGDGSVGKSTLIQRIITGQFKDHIAMTIGVDFYTYKMQFENKEIVLQLWDLGGQERFQMMHSCYIKGAKAGVVIYDVTRCSSMEKLDHWFQLLRSENPSLPIMLLGSKADLADPTKINDFLQDPYFAQYNPSAHIAVSSANGMGIDTFLYELAIRLLNVMPNAPLIHVKAN